jgi:hypothetical protein
VEDKMQIPAYRVAAEQSKNHPEKWHKMYGISRP